MVRFEDDSRLDKQDRVLEGTNFVAYSRAISGQIEYAYRLYLEEKEHRELGVDLNGKVEIHLGQNGTASTTILTSRTRFKEM